MRTVLIILSACTLYAVLRYNIAKDVDWSHLPLFIGNKALSLAALGTLLFTFCIRPLHQLGMASITPLLDERKIIGMTGYLLVFLHLIISFLIFNPAYYQKFYTDSGKLTGAAELSMLCGVLAFAFIWGYSRRFQTFLRGDAQIITWLTSNKTLFAAILLVGGHLVFMGYKGWLTPEKWP